MCASVCPSQALFYGTREEIGRLRPRSRPINSFQFGNQIVTTKINMMVPRESLINLVDVAASLHQAPAPQTMAPVEDVLLANLYVGA
jgi:hypothetical protein